ncbi:MAG TPA: N-acetylmuramoyl-L-alanine amidase [Mycobacteriales bacterium]|nr:N-acetylmuramoyl-L-alanine amidase [Mycobacteriales bacterium]
MRPLLVRAARAGSVVALVGLALVVPVTSMPRVAHATVLSPRFTSVPVGTVAPAPSNAVRLPWPARFVAVSWTGDHDAAVRLATSTDGIGFTSPRDVGRDGVEEEGDPRTWSAVIYAPGSTALRLTSDVPLEGVEVTAIGEESARTVTTLVPAEPTSTATAAVAQPNVVSRAEWGADETIREQAYWTKSSNFHPVQKLVVHHTGDAGAVPPSPEEHIRAIYTSHVRSRGFSDIGYNFLVGQDGRIFEGRFARPYAPGEEPTGENDQGRLVTGAHAANHNAGSVGISLLGNFVSATPSQPSISALVDLLAWEADRHRIDPNGSTAYDNPSSSTDTPRTFANIAGHRDIGSTDCPGGILYSMLPSVRDQVAERLAGAVQDAGGRLNPVEPARVLDTRTDGGPIAGGTARALTVTGRGGVPTSGVVAVVLNVTAIEPTAAGFLTVYPGGTARPTASNLNFVAKQVVPNLVTVGVGSDGTVSIYVSAGLMHVAADVVGWYGDPSVRSGGLFAPVPPSRLLDTRAADGGGVVGPGESRALLVASRGGVPGTGADAVMLNVTAITPTSSGFVTVYPSGSTRPGTSNLNLVPKQVRPNLVLAKLGPDGHVSLYNASGLTHLAVDVVGWFGSPDSSAARGHFAALPPRRALDTRETIALSPNESRSLTLAGVADVPTSGAGAVLLNVTVDRPSASGYLTVHPSGGAPPVASNLNFVAGETVPNAVVVGLGADGAIVLTNPSGTTHAIVDVVGWYSTE